MRGLLIALIILCGIYVVYAISQRSVEPRIVVPPTGEVSITGEIVCLPHKDTSGPQTMECAFGLLDEQGRYYGLRDTDPMYSNVSSAPMGERVAVTGMFTPQQDDKYQSIGIIEVRGIVEAQPST